MADEVSGNHAALTGDHAAHLLRVLRARVGQEFDIATRSGVHRGTIVAISDDRVEFELHEEIPAAAAPRVILLLAVFKFDRMEWAIEKCTELGVSQIVPVIAHRTDAHLACAATKRVDRWRKIVLQSAEQSRRNIPPEIDVPITLTQALLLAGAARIVLSEAEREIQLRDAVAAHTEGDVALAIGPEGGWTEGERHIFAKAGWISASLGSTILRSETAAIAATSIVVSELS
jgi:16S rRNA (uracil1498-N3)-methyltransferase